QSSSTPNPSSLSPHSYSSPLSPTGDATPQSPPRAVAPPHALLPAPWPRPTLSFPPPDPALAPLDPIQSPRAASVRHSPAACAAERGCAAAGMREGGGAQRWSEGGFKVVGASTAVESEARGLAGEAHVAADVRDARVQHTQPSEPRRMPTGATAGREEVTTAAGMCPCGLLERRSGGGCVSISRRPHCAPLHVGCAAALPQFHPPAQAPICWQYSSELDPGVQVRRTFFVYLDLFQHQAGKH
ncbi:unnamed protein product, partial [Urochloa humidicola]